MTHTVLCILTECRVESMYYIVNMEHQMNILVCTLIFFYNIQTSVGALGDVLTPKSPDLISRPDVSNVKARSIGPNGDPKAKTFKVASNSNINLKRCINSVEVSGQGVLDKFNLKCDKINGLITNIGTDKFVAYDNPSQRLRFFTNTPGTLTVVKDGKCTKRSYTIEKARTFYKPSEMSIEDCKKANKDMEEAVRTWQTNFEEEMKKADPDCYPFCGANEPEGVKDKDNDGESKPVGDNGKGKDGDAGDEGDKGGVGNKGQVNDNQNGKDDSEELWSF